MTKAYAPIVDSVPAVDSARGDNVAEEDIDLAPRFEIVKVVNRKYLIDSESYQRRYLTADAKPLSPGHYIVLWPSAVTKQDYDHCARFVGPFRSASHAKLLLVRCLEECAAGTRRSLSNCFAQSNLVRYEDFRGLG